LQGRSTELAAQGIGEGDKGKSGHRATNPPQQLGRHGVLPCQFLEERRKFGANWAELFLKGLERGIAPRQTLSS